MKMEDFSHDIILHEICRLLQIHLIQNMNFGF